jgi:hypothetical protein
MPRPTIKKIAGAVRLALEDISKDPHVYRYWDLDDFCGACSHSSLVLAGLLRKFGYKSDFVVGWYKYRDDGCGNHCWVETGKGKVVDVTATQFGIKSRIYVPKTKKRYGVIKKGTSGERYVHQNWDRGAWEPRILKKIKDKAISILRGT